MCTYGLLVYASMAKPRSQAATVPHRSASAVPVECVCSETAHQQNSAVRTCCFSQSIDQSCFFAVTVAALSFWGRRRYDKDQGDCREQPNKH